MISYGYTSYNEIKPVGNCVLIKKLMEDGLRKSHDLYIPQSKKFENNKIGVGKILDLSKKAKEETGIKKGDYVLYDYYSSHNDASINVLVDYENVLIVLTKEETDKFLNGTL